MILAAAAAFTVLTFRFSVADAQNDVLARSPDVASARARVAEQDANVSLARSGLAPALVANYQQAPQLGPDNISTVAQHTTTVGAQVTLGDLFAYSPALAQASSQLAAAKADEANVERTERINAITLYYTALTAEAIADARQDAMTLAGKDRQAAQLRFKEGDAPKLDVLRAEVAYSQAELDLYKAWADREAAAHALSIATGVPENVMFTNRVPADLAEPATSIDGPGSVALALANRPELVEAQANVAAEEHAVALARLGILPAITIVGGYASGTDTNVRISGPSVSVNATLPLGTPGASRTNAEKARLEQAVAQVEKIKRQISNELFAAVNSESGTLLEQHAALRALSASQDERDATETGYRSGATSSLDFEAARSAYAQAVVTAETAYYAHEQAKAVFQLLLGK